MIFDAVMQHSVLFVMATTHEYGPALQKRITPLITGVGPVEAAIGLTKALAALDAESNLPRLVVALGSAGSATLEHAGLYQAHSISYRDIDASPLGFEKGCTPFLDLPAVISIPTRLPGMPQASLSTGGNIVTGAVYDSIDADMVDMETFALLRACQSYGVPLLSIRGISDGRNEVSKLSDWTDYLHIIDERLALAVDDVFRALNEGSLGVYADRAAAPPSLSRRPDGRIRSSLRNLAVRPVSSIRCQIPQVALLKPPAKTPAP